MRDRLETYTAYSVGCAIVWAIILLGLIVAGKSDKLRTVLPVCGGWWIGWTSATIARYGYPPPKSRPPWAREGRSVVSEGATLASATQAVSRSG